jgi:hypothetical protein
VHIFETVILDFDYSERDKRVGAVMRDYSIFFYDFRDEFQIEATIRYNLVEI